MKKLISLLVFFIALQINATEFNTITNDCFWTTIDDDYIFSQGGGIFQFPDPETSERHYYWYGVKYQEAVDYTPNALSGSNSNITHFLSVTCYKSDDLVNWEFVNDVLTVDYLNSINFAWWVGRLGVAYIPEKNKYALFVQYNDKVGVFVCDTPTGDFKYHQEINMESKIGTTNTGDQTVFTDDDGTSYLCYSKANGRNKIYLSKIGIDSTGNIGLVDCNLIYSGSGREGDCMFKYNGKYYVCASDLYGWNASNVYYLEAENIYGPYIPTNNMQKMPGATDDYGHVTQTGFFYTLKGTEEETVIYCGDRWAGFAGNGNGFNQWVPLSFEDNKPYFNSLSQWSLNAVTGEWKVEPGNNYIKNFSFDADRVNIPSSKKPAQTYIKGWSFDMIKGNKAVQGGADSPVLNAKNSKDDRKYVMGNFCLNITDKIDFTRRIYQNISSTTRVPLVDGVYTMTAKVKCSAAFNELYIYATSGDKTLKTDINFSDNQWHTLAVENVVISGGNVEVGIYADGNANMVAKVDDMSLILTSSDDTYVNEVSNSFIEATEYYSVEGIRLDRPRKGINIVSEKSGNKISTRKILMK